jgi:hypothetical protein
MLVHFAPDDFGAWQLVRLERPDGGSPSTSGTQSDLP